MAPVYEKKMLYYAKLTLYGKRKRLRKKAFYRLVELCGFDNEGLVNYARVVKYIQLSKMG